MLRTGKICASLIYKYISTSLSEENDDIIAKSLKLKCLSEVFDNCGGVLTKISQIMKYQYGISDSNVFSECKPYNEEETLQFILDKMEDKNYSKNIKSFDSTVYKSGTVGQIHKAVYIDDQEIVLKVQYSGLLEQFKTDISILKSIINFMFSTLSDTIEDIEIKLYEELDFTNEFQNHEIFYKIWENNEFIKIPTLIPELCDNKIMGMSLIHGESLNQFINNSTQEEKNKIGVLLVQFVFTSLYKHNIFYNDSHYGNFIIENKDTLHIVDFGSVNVYNDELLNKIKMFHKSMINDDIEDFYESATELGIINDEISEESREILFPTMKRICKPWIINDEFEFTEDFINELTIHETHLSKEWKAGDVIYLAKIPYGLCNILQKLNLKYNFHNFFTNLIYS
jgi:predicted unusual protein kinase regulating ubiquinone biosynthesis (AarF/ABC1/UbiB family)